MRTYGWLAPVAALVFIAPPDADAASTRPWEMHTIQAGTPGVGNFDGADGVDLVDLDGDDLPEVTSAHEQGHRVSLSVHPGRFGDPEAPWETLNLPEGDRLAGAEDAVFGRVDADETMDVVVGTEGNSPRVSILFGSQNPSDPPDETDWTKVDIQASIGRKAMRVAVADMNGDGNNDILVGEKESSSTPAKLGYYSPPDDPRQPTGWTYHEISPAGWVMQMMAVDIDGDDDLDVLYSDKDPIDIDVPAPDRTRMGVRWFENSGGPDPSWTVHQITPPRERFHKWFSYVDWNGDGDKEVIDCRSGKTTINEIAIWLDDGSAQAWIKVPGPDLVDAGVGQCQHVTAELIDGDDELDLASTFSHADGHSGVVWWKNTGTPTAPEWERNEISGTAFGIKYDNLAWADLDADGDLDAVTTEQHEDTNGDSKVGPGLGVIWYENPAVEP